MPNKVSEPDAATGREPRSRSAPPPVVVAIGVSKDGHVALQRVLGPLRETLQAAILVVRHVNPKHTSMLSRILGRAIALPVRDAAAGEPLQSGVVYLAPPDLHLVVSDGHVGLDTGPKVSFTRPSIDVLFESVARVCGPRAVGVLLSGGGSDGAAGLAAIRRVGGTTIVQDPAEASAPFMPRAALAVDGHRVARIDDIAEAVRLAVEATMRRMPTISSAKLARPVSTVMTRRAVQIIEQIPMAEVRNIAARYDYNSFPVVTSEGRLVGMITKGDLLRVACEAVDAPAVWHAPVSRFMAHGVLALRETDTLAEAVRYMMESKLRSLPVIDVESRVAGMVSRNDLMAAIAPEQP